MVALLLPRVLSHVDVSSDISLQTMFLKHSAYSAPYTRSLLYSTFVKALTA